MSVITVSGNAGSGAIDVGQRVAKMLKLDYMDRDILLESATALGVSMDAMAHRDERTLSFRERLATMLRDFLERSAVAGAADPMMGSGGLEVLMATTYSEAAALPPREVSEFSDARYKEAITTIIDDVANKGDVLIIGRGSQVILEGKPGVLHVCVTAPFEIRVERIAQRDGISIEAAKHQVHDSDKGRIDYHHKYFKVDPTDASLYDLTVNTGHLSSKDAADLIVAAYRRKMSHSE
jgi:cytidylate kinase